MTGDPATVTFPPIGVVLLAAAGFAIGALLGRAVTWLKAEAARRLRARPPGV